MDRSDPDAQNVRVTSAARAVSLRASARHMSDTPMRVGRCKAGRLALRPGATNGRDPPRRLIVPCRRGTRRPPTSPIRPSRKRATDAFVAGLLESALRITHGGVSLLGA